MKLTDTNALLGMILGTAGFVLGILNYLRDRPKVAVTLQWDMSVTDNPILDPRKKWALITVTSVGRRPVYIVSVSLKLPKVYKQYLLTDQSIGGRRIAEGDPPANYPVSQDELVKYSKGWEKILAVAYDSSGRKYVSRRVDTSKRPSWLALNQ